jgi:hypothetical protein
MSSVACTDVPEGPAASSLKVKDGGSIFLRYVGNLLPNYAVLYSGRHSPNIRKTFMGY